ncbi:MAG: hypothetical protein J7J91_10915 [Deltaproteobacteria bacterium]|nr:hypothetical protein [Deltaproteobacteria bacterium]
MKVVIYCPVADEIEMFRFATRYALENAGTECEFVAVIDSITSREVRDYIREKGYSTLEVKGERGDWLYNLYACWNRGYDAFYEYNADVVVPFGVDHAFYKGWLKYLVKYVKPNRIVNCKLIESGRLPSIHECRDFGEPVEGRFKLKEFYEYCERIWRDELVTDERSYGRRFDAMPFAVPKEVWELYGPMPKRIVDGVTGDTYFFNRCRENGVEIVKSLGSISYHYQKRG